MKTIAAVTTSRADWGIYQPVLRAIRDDAELALKLIVSGTHLSDAHGRTERLIAEAGFAIDHRVPIAMDTDTPAGVTRAMGVGVTRFGELFAEQTFDLLMVLGDRFEIHAAALAALPHRLPVAHIHGGETSQGAIDESLRHGITKLSHLHFVSHPAHAVRVIRMGEPPRRVLVSGAPALDALVDFEPMSREQLAAAIGVPLDGPFLLVTFHPVTLEADDTDLQVGQLFQAVANSRLPAVISMPNADPSASAIRGAIDAFLAARDDCAALPELGQRGYWSVMHHAAAMVGNSSSGIIEAASFGRPVVNVGNRQRGRMHGPNVIDVPCEAAAIGRAIERATRDDFRAALADLVNPYGDGRAAPRIVQAIKAAPPRDQLIVKPFHDGPVPEEFQP